MLPLMPPPAPLPMPLSSLNILSGIVGLAERSQQECSELPNGSLRKRAAVQSHPPFRLTRRYNDRCLMLRPKRENRFGCCQPFLSIRSKHCDLQVGLKCPPEQTFNAGFALTVQKDIPTTRMIRFALAVS